MDYSKIPAVNSQNLIYIPPQNHKKSKKTFSPTPSVSVMQDSVSLIKPSSNRKMRAYAINLLKQNHLQKDRPVYIKTDAYYLPFVSILQNEAYKRGSGHVYLDIKEPELEELRQKYNITEEFDFKAKYKEEYKNRNALFFIFDKDNNPYQKCALTNKEIKTELKKFCPQIPKKVIKKYNINPKEIFYTALDIHKGEPVEIYAEREQMPIVKKLLNFLFSKNKTKLVDLRIHDKTNLSILKYGSDKTLEFIPDTEVEKHKEKYEKDTAFCQLYGADPNEYDHIESEKIVRRSKAYSNAINEYHVKSTNENPWLVYYTPSLKMAQAIYPEYKDKPMDALEKAYTEANKINRNGHITEHVKSLAHRADAMNKVLKQGYRTLHYVSVNPETKLPDGKTDFKITLSDKSMFNTCAMDFTKTGHHSIVNIPSEEVFTSPRNDTAQGRLCTTMPLVLNGKLIEDIEFTFKDGKIVNIKAKTNEDMLKKHIEAYENADRLGEVALVADSPIARTGKIFKNILLDENAACHFALGNAYSDCIEGIDKIDDFQDQQDYLKKEHINISATHNDFMVGGPNVYIYAENPKTGKSIAVIKDDKFLL